MILSKKVSFFATYRVNKNTSLFFRTILGQKKRRGTIFLYIGKMGKKNTFSPFASSTRESSNFGYFSKVRKNPFST